MLKAIFQGKSFSSDRFFKQLDVRISLVAGFFLLCSLFMVKAQANSAYYGALNDSAMFDKAQTIMSQATQVTQSSLNVYDELQTGHLEAFSEGLTESYAAPVLQMTNPALASALGLSDSHLFTASSESTDIEMEIDTGASEGWLDELGPLPMDDLSQHLKLDEKLEETASFKLNYLSFANPVAHPNISSPFGVRHGKSHTGTDFQAPIGTPITASAAGRVVEAGFSGAYGNLIVIDHGSGIMSRYAHCASIIAKVNQSVSRGQLIGKIGTTGRSTGPHLHFELVSGGSYINPVRYLPTGRNATHTVVMRKGFKKISEL